MIVGDHQLHPAQAAVGEAAQELGPEGFGLRGTCGHAQHLALAVLVDPHGDYHGTADDPPALADLEVGRIEPEIGPRALQRPGQESVHTLVDFGAEAADLALGHAARAHRLDQVVDRARRDAVDVGLLNNGNEGLLGRASGLQKAREGAAGTPLRSFGISSAIRPARVSQSRSRYPLR